MDQTLQAPGVASGLEQLCLDTLKVSETPQDAEFHVANNSTISLCTPRGSLQANLDHVLDINLNLPSDTLDDSTGYSVASGGFWPHRRTSGSTEVAGRHWSSCRNSSQMLTERSNSTRTTEEVTHDSSHEQHVFQRCSSRQDSVGAMEDEQEPVSAPGRLQRPSVQIKMLEQKKDLAEAALHVLMRLIADGESELEEMRKRLLVTPKCAFKLLHERLGIPVCSPLTAENLRIWLSSFGLGAWGSAAFTEGREFEALIARYSDGSTSLDLQGVIRMVKPRNGDGPCRMQKPPFFIANGGKPSKVVRAFQSQKAVRLAQLIERELQLMRGIIRRQRQLTVFHGLDPLQSFMLLSAVSGADLSISELHERFLKDEGKPPLSPQQLECLARYISFSPSEHVQVQDWVSFMRLGELFPPVETFSAFSV